MIETRGMLGREPCFGVEQRTHGRGGLRGTRAREDFVVTIDRSDANTAFVKVRCQWPPRYFTDYLVAMKLPDGWQIVSKSYRYDLRE